MDSGWELEVSLYRKDLCTFEWILAWYFFHGSIPCVSRVIRVVKCRFLTFFGVFGLFQLVDFFSRNWLVELRAIFWYVVEQLSKKIPSNFYPLLSRRLGARFFWKTFPKITRSILTQKGVIFCPLCRGRVPPLIDIFSIWFLHLVASIVEISCIHGTRGLGLVVLEVLLIQKMGCVCHVYSAARCASYESWSCFPFNRLENDMSLSVLSWDVVLRGIWGSSWIRGRVPRR